MGAGGWVGGGLRRAVSGVRSAMPGQGEPEPAEQPAAHVAPTEEKGSADPRAKPAPAKPAPAKPAPAKPAPARKSPAKTAQAKTPARKSPAKKPAPTKPVAAEPAATSAPAGAPSEQGPPAAAPTWTPQELAGFRVALETDILRLREELHMGEADMADLIADSSDGAGDDQADAGSKTLEREQEMSVNANARDLLEQSTHALRRLEAGTYGICESCGKVIPAARLRAFPRATLCIACKQAEERR